MKTTFWKTLSWNLLYVLIFIIGYGVYSYLYADGAGVFGPTLSNVEAQRAEIVTGTLWSLLIIGGFAIFSLVMSKR